MKLLYGINVSENDLKLGILLLENVLLRPKCLSFTIKYTVQCSAVSSEELMNPDFGDKLETVGTKVGQLIFSHDLHYFVPKRFYVLDMDKIL